MLQSLVDEPYDQSLHFERVRFLFRCFKDFLLIGSDCKSSKVKFCCKASNGATVLSSHGYLQKKEELVKQVFPNAVFLNECLYFDRTKKEEAKTWRKFFTPLDSTVCQSGRFGFFFFFFEKVSQNPIFFYGKEIIKRPEWSSEMIRRLSQAYEKLDGDKKELFKSLVPKNVKFETSNGLVGRRADSVFSKRVKSTFGDPIRHLARFLEIEVSDEFREQILEIPSVVDSKW